MSLLLLDIWDKVSIDLSMTKGLIIPSWKTRLHTFQPLNLLAVFSRVSPFYSTYSICIRCISTVSRFSWSTHSNATSMTVMSERDAAGVRHALSCDVVFMFLQVCGSLLACSVSVARVTRLTALVTSQLIFLWHEWLTNVTSLSALSLLCQCLMSSFYFWCGFKIIFCPKGAGVHLFGYHIPEKYSIMDFFGGGGFMSWRYNGIQSKVFIIQYF